MPLGEAVPCATSSPPWWAYQRAQGLGEAALERCAQQRPHAIPVRLLAARRESSGEPQRRTDRHDVRQESDPNPTLGPVVHSPHGPLQVVTVGGLDGHGLRPAALVGHTVAGVAVAAAGMAGQQRGTLRRPACILRRRRMHQRPPRPRTRAEDPQQGPRHRHKVNMVCSRASIVKMDRSCAFSACARLHHRHHTRSHTSSKPLHEDRAPSHCRRSGQPNNTRRVHADIRLKLWPSALTCVLADYPSEACTSTIFPTDKAPPCLPQKQTREAPDLTMCPYPLLPMPTIEWGAVKGIAAISPPTHQEKALASQTHQDGPLPLVCSTACTGLPPGSWVRAGQKRSVPHPIPSNTTSCTHRPPCP